MSTIMYQLTTFMGHLLALIAQGYEVTFEPDASPPARGARFWAHVIKTGEPGSNVTAEGDSPWAALWNASPLHGDADPLPPLPCGAEQGGVHCTEPAHAKGHHYGPDEGNGVRKMWLDGPVPGELHAEMDAISGRVAKLEEVHGGTPGQQSDHEEQWDRLHELESRLDVYDKRESSVVAVVHLLGNVIDMVPRADFQRCFPLPAGYLPPACAMPGCGHGHAPHWEVTEEDGTRKGCATPGCGCAGWAEPKRRATAG